MNELSDKIYDEILSLCKQGDKEVNAQNFSKAIENYKLALNLIPEPKNDWDSSTWIYTALGDTYFFLEEYDNGLDCLFQALKCPNGMGNPFIVLRIGQCFFEKNNVKMAREYLLQAYMLEGADIFATQEKKYFELIKNII